jgi:hypothetical protein
MTALPANRPHCQHPSACLAKGQGHCRVCNGAAVGAAHWRKATENAGKKSAEARRAKKVQITLPPLRSQSRGAAG